MNEGVQAGSVSKADRSSLSGMLWSAAIMLLAVAILVTFVLTERA
jgi:hypothetical protein